jgi:hypothetical protein
MGCAIMQSGVVLECEVKNLQGRDLWVAVVCLVNEGKDCAIAMPPAHSVPVRDVGMAGALAIDTAVTLCQETPHRMLGIYGVYLSRPLSVEHLREFAVPNYGNITTHPAVVGLIVPSKPIGWDYLGLDGHGNPPDYVEA